MNTVTPSFHFALINSQSVEAVDSRKFSVFNPSNNLLISEVADCGVKEAEAALTSAFNAFDAWSLKTAAERAALLLKWHALFENRSEEIALLITEELGKSIKDSRAEVAYGNSYIRWFAEEARRNYGTLIPSPVTGRELKVVARASWGGGGNNSMEFPICHVGPKNCPRSCFWLHSCR